MKMTYLVATLLSIPTWVAAQRAPVIVAGGTPPVGSAQVFQQANGDFVIVYGGAAGSPTDTVVVPGRPPNRVFTNDLGEVGIVWSAPVPAAPVAVTPVPVPPVVVPSPAPAPAPTPVVSPPSPLLPPTRLFTNADGSIIVIYAR